MRLELEEFPQYWNAYDSIAEVLVAKGDKQQAIVNYEKSIVLNPHNDHGIAVLKSLKQ